MTLRGGAEALLLLLWGRLDFERAGVDVDGDRAVLARWTELVPPM
jgi:MDMPI-like protein